MNALVGWIWVNLGFLSGVALGLGFLRPGFLGGYDAPRRRLVRLGHISFFGLGGLNILFGLGAGTLALGDPWSDLAAVGLTAGAVTMPLACGLVAWRQALLPCFAVPVLSLVGAGQIIMWRMLL
jgi:hypothetical protein